MDFDAREASGADISALQECYLRSWRGAYDAFVDPSVLDHEARKRAGFDWSSGIGS